MRIIILLPLILTGCSTLIVGSGRHGDILNQESNRSKVRAKLGAPIESCTTGDRQYDYYHVAGRVIPDETELNGYIQGIVLSFGTVEVFALPMACVMVPLDSKKEHKLTVFYRPNGNYLRHDTDVWPFQGSGCQIDSQSNEPPHQGRANSSMERNR